MSEFKKLSIFTLSCLSKVFTSATEQQYSLIRSPSPWNPLYPYAAASDGAAGSGQDSHSIFHVTLRSAVHAQL
jgi:hypothetical protein